MDILTWGRNPWDQAILTHVSWDLMWASLFAGVAFLVAHAGYMVLSAHRKRHAAETDAMEAARTDLPERIVRHSMVARLFHWVMAAAMFTLLVTAFFPIAGIKFAWVTWHWAAGLVLSGSILFHVIHATFWLDFWSIWVGPRDIPELKAEVLRELGHDVAGGGTQTLVQLAGAQPSVERVLQRTGLDRLFHIHPDRATGIQAF